MKNHRDPFHEQPDRIFTQESQSRAQGFKFIENISVEDNEGNTMQMRKVKVVGRSVTALAMGVALTIGGVSLASASSHHVSNFKHHDVASGKTSKDGQSNGQSDAVRGIVTADTNTSVTVQSRNDTLTTFTLTSTTTFSEGSKTLSASDLAVGERISIKTSSSAPTTALSIKIDLADVAGKVTAVSGNSITVSNDQGSSQTVVVTASTTYSQDGASAVLADVVVGSKIRAQGTLSSNQMTLNAISVEIDHVVAPTLGVTPTLDQSDNQGTQDSQDSQVTVNGQATEDSQDSQVTVNGEATEDSQATEQSQDSQTTLNSSDNQGDN
jgi:hypothetical protein